MRRRRGCGVAVVLGLLGGGAALCAGVVGVPVLGAAGVRGEAALREQEDPASVAPGRLLATPEGLLHVVEWLPDLPSDGPLVVLVHGSAAWSGVWEPVAMELRQRGVKVVAVDLPPFGYSERPTSPTYGRGDQARRIWAAVDALEGERVVLVGHSFGAGPVMEAAMVRPHRTAGVVLLAGALSLGSEPSSLGPLGWRPLTEVLVAGTLTQPRAYPAGLRSMVHDDTVVTEVWVERYTGPLQVAGTTAAVADWLPELLAPGPGKSLQEASYRALEVPVRLVAGVEDRVTPPEQLAHVDGLLPQSTLVVLPEVGHLPPVEAPMEVVDQIEGFVRGL